jgi:hypothetical protein
VTGEAWSQLVADEGEPGPLVSWLYDDGSRIALRYEAEQIEWVPWPRPGGGWFLPSRFEVLVEIPAVPYGVEIKMRVTNDGRAICSAFTLWRARTLHNVVQTERMDEPYDITDTTTAEISSEGLRKVPASRLIRWAILAAHHRFAGAEGRRGELEPPNLDEWAHLFTTEGRRRRRRLDDSHFREVAAVYRSALRFGRPTQAVADHFVTGKSTAGRWVVEARRRGYLGKTVAGRAGEQDPNDEEQA